MNKPSTQASSPLLQLENLSVTFATADGPLPAVRSVNLCLHEGETVCLVGESGCGKGLTAKAILQLTPPNAVIEGRILLHGQNLLELSEKEMRSVRGRQVGMIFQEPMTSLNPVLKIGDQVAEPLRLHQGMNRSEAREAAIELLTEVGIPAPQSRYDDYPHQLSGGMRQRVMIAMALSCRPALLLADEPTTALDATIQGQILRLLAARCRERRMAVLNPLKVTITTLPENAEEMAEVLNNPEKPEEGVRRLPITREVWIERDDFMLDPPKKYFRLAPGRTVRLRGGYCITCTDYKQDAEGTITEIFCEHIPGTIGSNPPEGIQCRAAIHWVSTKYAVDGEIRIYDRLFTEENPDAAEEGFLSVMNPSSLTVITNAKLEPSLAGAEPEFRCQFERLGYFVADRRDHVPGRRPVFNRTVALKDSWAKKQK